MYTSIWKRVIIKYMYNEFLTFLTVTVFEWPWNWPCQQPLCIKQVSAASFCLDFNLESHGHGQRRVQRQWLIVARQRPSSATQYPASPSPADSAFLVPTLIVRMNTDLVGLSITAPAATPQSWLARSGEVSSHPAEQAVWQSRIIRRWQTAHGNFLGGLRGRHLHAAVFAVSPTWLQKYNPGFSTVLGAHGRSPESADQ